jgi:hypothetical protein
MSWKWFSPKNAVRALKRCAIVVRTNVVAVTAAVEEVVGTAVEEVKAGAGGEVVQALNVRPLLNVTNSGNAISIANQKGRVQKVQGGNLAVQATTEKPSKNSNQMR